MTNPSSGNNTAQQSAVPREPDVVMPEPAPIVVTKKSKTVVKPLSFASAPVIDNTAGKSMVVIMSYYAAAKSKKPLHIMK